MEISGSFRVVVPVIPDRVLPDPPPSDPAGLAENTAEQKPGLAPAELDALQAMDAQAQDAFVRRFRPMVMGISMRILRDESRATPLVQDLLTDFLFDAVHRIEEPRAVGAYLRIMAIRRSQRERIRMERHRDPDGVPDEVFGVAESADLDQRRAQRATRECVDGLTEKARQTVKLHFAHGLTLQDIGGHQGRSRQAVHRSVQRALAALKTCIEDKLGTT